MLFADEDRVDELELGGTAVGAAVSVVAAVEGEEDGVEEDVGATEEDDAVAVAGSLVATGLEASAAVASVALVRDELRSSTAEETNVEAEGTASIADA